jgi:hypothetical protein
MPRGIVGAHSSDSNARLDRDAAGIFQRIRRGVQDLRGIGLAGGGQFAECGG